MEKTIFVTRIDEEMEEVVREIEQLELFCDNLFGIKELHTLQEYVFCYFISHMGHNNYFKTLSNMESLAIAFLSWQNKLIPDSLFCVEGEVFEVKEFSHGDDFTWDSIFTQMKLSARHSLREEDEFPLTEKVMTKTSIRNEEMEKSRNSMEEFFRNRDIEARKND